MTSTQSDADTAAVLQVARRLRLLPEIAFGLVPVAAPEMDRVLRALGRGLVTLGVAPVALVPAWRHWGRTGARATPPGVERFLPPAAPDLLAAIDTLGQVLRLARRRYARILVDLDGLYAASAFAPDLVDGLLLVAAARRTRERELRARAASVPDGKLLGVILANQSGTSSPAHPDGDRDDRATFPLLRHGVGHLPSSKSR